MGKSQNYLRPDRAKRQKTITPAILLSGGHRGIMVNLLCRAR
jgi:hypothetical protein